MKNLKIYLFIGSAFFASVGCNNSGNNQTGSQNAGVNLSEDDEEFVNAAAEGGMLEVELGKIAQQHCSNNRVRDFGAMMVKDHSAANEELKAYAASKNFMLPASLGDKHQKHLEKLKKKTGVEFDKEYMEMMVKDHNKDIKEFEDAAKDSKDRDLQAWAAKTLPVLKIHQDSAKAINKQTKVTLPAGNVTEGMERQSYP